MDNSPNAYHYVLPYGEHVQVWSLTSAMATKTQFAVPLVLQSKLTFPVFIRRRLPRWVEQQPLATSHDAGTAIFGVCVDVDLCRPPLHRSSSYVCHLRLHPFTFIVCQLSQFLRYALLMYQLLSSNFPVSMMFLHLYSLPTSILITWPSHITWLLCNIHLKPHCIPISFIVSLCLPNT